jgi:hypothetical protein
MIVQDTKTKVAFKVIKYGAFKGDVVAVFQDVQVSRGHKMTFVLLEGHNQAANDWIRTQTRNANEKEYSATKFALENTYGYNLEVINNIKY